MDDMQFNQSLDDLLAGENLRFDYHPSAERMADPTRVTSSSGFMLMNNNSSNNSKTVNTCGVNSSSRGGGNMNRNSNVFDDDDDNNSNADADDDGFNNKNNNNQLNEQLESDLLNDLEPLEGVEPTKISYSSNPSSASLYHLHHDRQQQQFHQQFQRHLQQPKQVQQQYVTVSTNMVAAPPTRSLTSALITNSAAVLKQNQQQQSLFPHVTSSGVPGISHGMSAAFPASAGVATATTASSVASGGGNLPLGFNNLLLPAGGSSGVLPAGVPSGGGSVSSANSRGSSSRASKSNKRRRDSITEISEDDEDQYKRRQGRNMREQQRSQKISLQIEHLRDLLTNANVPFKPDKFSTLITVVDYIKQLQRRSAVLDAEQKKLIDTISKTNQVVNDSHLPLSARSTSSMSDETTSASNSARSSGAPTSGISSMLCMSSDPITAGTPQDVTSCGGRQIGRSGENETSRPGGDMAFIQSVDYRTIFFKTVLPLAVASIDGRFIDCNPEFERLSGYTRSELLPALLESRNVSLDGSVGIIDGFHGSAIGHNYLTVPDVTTSSHIDGTAAAGPPHVKASDDSDPFAVNSTACNMSLFNVLCRENMEEVFVVLSEMLKYVPINDEGVLQTTTPPTSRNDYWSGAVRLNRNPGLELRMNLSLVRTEDGKAKFFDVAICHAPTMSTG